MEPGEPSDQQKREFEAVYRSWCAAMLLDPDDQQSAREYEKWYQEKVQEIFRE